MKDRRIRHRVHRSHKTFTTKPRSPAKHFDIQIGQASLLEEGMEPGRQRSEARENGGMNDNDGSRTSARSGTGPMNYKRGRLGHIGV